MRVHPETKCQHTLENEKTFAPPFANKYKFGSMQEEGYEVGSFEKRFVTNHGKQKVTSSVATLWSAVRSGVEA